MQGSNMWDGRWSETNAVNCIKNISLLDVVLKHWMDNRETHNIDHVVDSIGATVRLEENMDYPQLMVGMAVVIGVHQWVTSTLPQLDTITVIEEIDHVLVIVIPIHRVLGMVLEGLETVVAHRDGSAIDIQAPITVVVLAIIVSTEAAVMEGEGMIEDIIAVGIKL